MRKGKLKIIWRSELVAEAGGEFWFKHLRKQGIIPRASIGATKGPHPREAGWFLRSLGKWRAHKEREAKNSLLIKATEDCAQAFIKCGNSDPDAVIQLVQMLGSVILEKMKIPWAYHVLIPGIRGIKKLPEIFNLDPDEIVGG